MRISEGKNWFRLAIAMSIVGAIIAGGVSFTAPPLYVASASIGITPQPDPVRPLPPAELRRRAVERFHYQNVLSRQSLAMIINDPVENIMRHDVAIHQDTSAANPVFDIAFAYPDREKAQATVRAIADRLVEESVQENRNRTEVYRNLWIDWSVAHGGKPAPPPPVGDNVLILKPPSLPKDPEAPSRIGFLASGAGIGLALGLLTATLQRRKHSLWRACGYATAGWVLALAASFLIPNRYTATAVMTISPATLTPDPLQPPPPATPAERFLRRMEQNPRVLSARARHDVHVEPLAKGSSSFRISFSDHDRKSAVFGLNMLVTAFIDENAKLLRASAEQRGAIEQTIIERRAGEYLALLDAPTVPQRPEFPPRLAISIAGLLAGLSIGAFAPRFRTA
jgi:hypothetical protein